MLKTVTIAVLAYIGTNIDDIFIIALLFASVFTADKRRQIIAGRYLGIAALTAVSMVGAGGIRAVAGHYTRLLGVVPLIMGVKAACDRIKNREDEDGQSTAKGNMIVTAAGMTIASGGDNIGVYLPLMAGMSYSEIWILCIVFAVMTGIWCLLGYYITRIPVIQKTLDRYKNIIVPVVYVLLGLYILI